MIFIYQKCFYGIEIMTLTIVKNKTIYMIILSMFMKNKKLNLEHIVVNMENYLQVIYFKINKTKNSSIIIKGGTLIMSCIGKKVELHGLKKILNHYVDKVYLF